MKDRNGNLIMSPLFINQLCSYVLLWKQPYQNWLVTIKRDRIKCAANKLQAKVKELRLGINDRNSISLPRSLDSRKQRYQNMWSSRLLSRICFQIKQSGEATENTKLKIIHDYFPYKLIEYDADVYSKYCIRLFS